MERSREDKFIWTKTGVITMLNSYNKKHLVVSKKAD